MHHSSHHTSNTVATTAVPDSIIEVKQSDNGPIAGYILIGILIGLVLGVLTRWLP